MVDIHPTALVEKGAVLGEGTTVGPYSVVGPRVVLGKNNKIASHVVIEGSTTFGDNNSVFQFASIGAAPQDLKFRGEESKLVVGNGNIIREYVTLQLGTENGHMKTIVGDENMFMACSHVAHDCTVGSKNVFANSALLAGHVQIGNGTILGGLSGIHQFVRIGDFAMLSGGSMVVKDVPPFCIAQGDRAALCGVNTIGLDRNGFSKEEIQIVKKLYRTLFFGGGSLSERVEDLRREHSDSQAASRMLGFITESTRGVLFHRGKGEQGAE